VGFLHPGKAATVAVNGEVTGVAGALHPRLCQELDLHETPWVFELDFATLLHYARAGTTYQPPPRFPTVVRDLAVVADVEVLAQAVIDAILAISHPLVVDARIFDRYQGPSIPQGKQSLAYSIAYRAADRTLTAPEVNEAHAQVIEHLTKTLGVEVRS
jgi:phenylalanyl-tRNA synthetase beta chain